MSTTTTEPLREVRARAAKAVALVAVLGEAGWDGSGELPDAAWLAAAKIAGVRPPSDRTRAIVVRTLADRARPVVRDTETDPFYNPWRR